MSDNYLLSDIFKHPPLTGLAACFPVLLKGRAGSRSRPASARRAETAVRTIGILVSRRSTQGQNGPRLETVDDRRQQRNFRRAIASWPLDCGLGPLPRSGVFA